MTLFLMFMEVENSIFSKSDYQNIIKIYENISIIDNCRLNFPHTYCSGQESLGR